MRGDVNGGHEYDTDGNNDPLIVPGAVQMPSIIQKAIWIWMFILISREENIHRFCGSVPSEQELPAVFENLTTKVFAQE